MSPATADARRRHAALALMAAAALTAGAPAAIVTSGASAALATASAGMNAPAVQDAIDVPPPSGVPHDDVALRDDREHARRPLRQITELLGPPASGDKPTIAPLDAASAEAADVKRRSARGTEALAQGKPLKAIPDFEAAIAIDPSDPELLRLLAQAYTQVGNEGRALQAYERLLLLKSDDAQALLATGTAAAAQRRHEDAVRRLATGLAAGRDPEHPLPPVSRVIGGRALGTALRELEFDAAASEAWSEALAALDQVDRERADAAGGVNPDTIRVRAELLLARADASARLGETVRALEDLAAIVALPGVDRDVVLPRELLMLERLGRSTDAEQRLVSSIVAGAAPSERSVELADWLVERSATRPALAQRAREAAAARPDAITAVRLLALVDPKSGSEGFAALLASSPGDAAALRGWFGTKAGDDAQALAAALTEQLMKAPEHGATTVAAALAGRVSERSLRTALEAMPASPARSAALARLALTGRDLGGAWTQLTKARAAYPDDIGLAITQLDAAGALEEPSLVHALEAGAPGTAEGLPNAQEHPAVALAAALALRTGGEAEASRTRLEALAERGAPRADTALARALVEQAMALPATDTRRREIGTRAAALAEAALARDPLDEDSAVLLLRLRGPSGVAPDQEAWNRLRESLRATPLAWLDDRVMVEEEIARGRVEPAMARLMLLAESRPFDGDLVALVVNLLARAERTNEAIEWLDGLLARHPALVSLRDARLSALAQGGRADDAAAELRRVMAEDPGDALAGWHYEAILRATDRQDEATTRSRQRLLARPEGVRRALELANLEQRAERPGESLASLEWIAARDTLPGAQRLAAVEIASRLPSSLPGRSETLIALAEPGLAEGGVDAVLYAAAAAVGVMDDARGGSRSEEAAALERVGDLARRAALSSAGASDDLVATMRWRDSAQMFLDTGSPAAAAIFLRARLEDATSLPPVALRALQSAAFAADAEARDRADASIELLRALRAKGIRPFEWARGVDDDEASMLMQLATLYTLVGDRPGSERILEQAITISPDHAMSLNNLAWARVERGLIDDRTVEMAERANTLAPSEAAILDTLGWVRYMQGRLKDGDDGSPGAVSLLKRAVERSAEEPSLEVLDHLGDALWATGDREGALRAWRDVIRNSAQRFDRTTLIPQLTTYLIGECGVRLADPETFYEEHFGRATQRAARKVADAEAGLDPVIAAPKP